MEPEKGFHKIQTQETKNIFRICRAYVLPVFHHIICARVRTSSVYKEDFTKESKMIFRFSLLLILLIVLDSSVVEAAKDLPGTGILIGGGCGGSGFQCKVGREHCCIKQIGTYNFQKECEQCCENEHCSNGQICR